jgi:hypothetical protein
MQRGMKHFQPSTKTQVSLDPYYYCAYHLLTSEQAFYRQSLQIQHLHAELFHNASALRNIISPEDVAEMGEHQRRLALRSIDIARKGLDITLNSPAYRKGMTYGECTLLMLSTPLLTYSSCSLHSCNSNFRCLFPSSSCSPLVRDLYSFCDRLTHEVPVLITVIWTKLEIRLNDCLA